VDVDETWWAPVPLRRNARTKRYEVEVWQRDRRFVPDRCLLCSLPLRRELSEAGIVATLAEYWPEYEWVWVAQHSAFFRRAFRPMVVLLGGSNAIPNWVVPE
jgi:hypothetical protein